MHTEICKTCPLSKVCHPELTPTNRSNGWFHLFRKPLLSYLNCSHFLLRSEASSIERNYKLAEENGTRRNFTGTYYDGMERVDLIGYKSREKAINAVGRVFSRFNRKWLVTG